MYRIGTSNTTGFIQETGKYENGGLGVPSPYEYKTNIHMRGLFLLHFADEV